MYIITIVIVISSIYKNTEAFVSPVSVRYMYTFDFSSVSFIIAISIMIITVYIS